MTYKEFRESGHLFDAQIGDRVDIIVIEDAAGQIVSFKSPLMHINFGSDDDYLSAVWDEIHQ